MVSEVAFHNLGIKVSLESSDGQMILRLPRLVGVFCKVC